ncbi:nickel pincer cofactor biosynthesis protein LarB [Natrialbaceae archaeon A-CW2]|uniref:nickel pincer cofactor biosynthesis protein LarB n=1 Tax=Natronosalvus amylolyticus TaxID=2961994 RepID=UPI0020C99466|nr:nickel pincer cofactor biosynthesis protein LarB [Natronosalvus amylolyticus]
MRELLEAVAAGEISPAEAEGRLNGYVTEEAGRFDAARPARRGIPEAILAEGKSVSQVQSLTVTSLETTGRALLTRLRDEQVSPLETHLEREAPEATVDRRGSTMLVTAETDDRPSVPATVAIVTAGTVDGPVADEAELVCVDGGLEVDRLEDVGVAALDRLLDQVERLRAADVCIVVAGREGALATVVAGLVNTPVIGVPVSSGYGHGGDGEAALAGMLQSCTVLSVVNIDAGFVAGAQATLIGRAVADVS